MEANSDALGAIILVFDRFIENHPTLLVSYTFLTNEVSPVVLGIKVFRDKKLFGYVTVKGGVIEFDPKLTMSPVRSDGILTESDIRNWIEQARFADIT